MFNEEENFGTSCHAFSLMIIVYNCHSESVNGKTPNFLRWIHLNLFTFIILDWVELSILMNESEIKDFILSRYDLTSHISHSCVLCLGQKRRWRFQRDDSPNKFFLSRIDWVCVDLDLLGSNCQHFLFTENGD